MTLLDLLFPREDHMVATDATSDAPARQRSFWHEHSLTIVILCGMLLAAVVFWLAGLEYWQAEQRAWRLPAHLAGLRRLLHRRHD